MSASFHHKPLNSEYFEKLQKLQWWFKFTRRIIVHTGLNNFRHHLSSKASLDSQQDIKEALKMRIFRWEVGFT